MVLLDTSALIDLAKGRHKAWKAIQRFEKNQEPIRIPTPAIFEFSAGSPPGLDEKRRKLLDRMHPVAFNEEHAEQAGILLRKLKDNGLEIGSVDAMIAGTAYVEKEKLLSRDKHFQRIPEILLEKYESD